VNYWSEKNPCENCGATSNTTHNESCRNANLYDHNGHAVPAERRPPTLPDNTFKHKNDTECMWSLTDQKWYRMHPLYPLRECAKTHTQGETI
jgi:hypothetical protein